jgi:hypothetical protein
MNKNHKSYLQFEIYNDLKVIGYQVNMIMNNEIPRLLQLSTIKFNNKEYIEYDITSKISLKRFMYNSKDIETINNILISICETMLLSNKFLLNENNFLIEENYIFVEPQSMNVFLIYLPIKENKSNYINELINMIKRIIPENDFSNKKIENLNDLKTLIENNRDTMTNVVLQNEIENIEIDNSKEEDGKIYKEHKNIINLIAKAVNYIKKNNHKNDKTNDIYEICNNKGYYEYERDGEIFFQVSEEDIKISEETALLNTEVKGIIKIKEKSYVIEKESFFIGRLKEKVDCYVDCINIGKIHAEILKKDHSFYVIDHNSKNGTFLNGTKITGNIEYILKENDMISFADVDAYFSFL